MARKNYPDEFKRDAVTLYRDTAGATTARSPMNSTSAPSPGGAVPAAPTPAGTPAVPDWGTQLTPQQMIDSEDPFLRVAGQEIRRRMAEQGIVDPSGTA